MFGKPQEKVWNEFIAQLNKEKIRFKENREKYSVNIVYDNDHYQDLGFYFSFDEDGESFSMHVFSIEKFAKSELPDAYEFCNRMNDNYRWFCFYVDGDDELTCRYDGIIRRETAGMVCSEVLHRAVRIVDKVCEELHS